MHKAVGFDGRIYAIKVQHYYLKDEAESDLKAITFMIRLLHKIFKEFEYEWLIREMNYNLPMELNFMLV